MKTSNSTFRETNLYTTVEREGPQDPPPQGTFGFWGQPLLQEMKLYTTVKVPNHQDPPPHASTAASQQSQQPPHHSSPPIPPPMQDQTLSNMQNYIAKYCPSHPYQSHNPKHRPYLSCFDDYVLDTHLGETLGVEQIQTMQQKFNNAIQLVLTARQQPQRPVAQEERITVYRWIPQPQQNIMHTERREVTLSQLRDLIYTNPHDGYHYYNLQDNRFIPIQHYFLPVHESRAPPQIR